MVSKDQEEKIIKETRQIVKIFLMTRASDIEIASKVGLSSSTVGRRLTNKERILKAFPDKGEKIYSVIGRLRRQNSLKGKLLGAETSKMTYGSAEVKQKLNIKLLGSSETKQYSKLLHLFLTYRPKLSLLSELFQIDEKELYDILMNNFYPTKNTLKYILEIELTDQDKARENIITFYHDLVVAKINNDKEAYKEVLSRIDDSKFLEAKEKHKANSPITEEIVNACLEYQIKYCLSKKDACRTLGISYSDYKLKLYAMIENHPRRRQFEQLSDFLRKGYCKGIER